MIESAYERALNYMQQMKDIQSLRYEAGKTLKLKCKNIRKVPTAEALRATYDVFKAYQAKITELRDIHKKLTRDLIDEFGLIVSAQQRDHDMTEDPNEPQTLAGYEYSLMAWLIEVQSATDDYVLLGNKLKRIDSKLKGMSEEEQLNYLLRTMRRLRLQHILDRH